MRHWAYDDPYAHYASELGDSYTGHYVLISGFDPASGNFVVHDPASALPSLEIPGEALDVARKCFGTDEDLLIVSARGLDPGSVEASLREQRGRAAGGGGAGGGGAGVLGGGWAAPRAGLGRAAGAGTGA